MFQNRCFDIDKNVDYTMNMMGDFPMQQFDGIECPVVYECPIEKVCHREIVHHVPHVCPINTRVVNHHIYRHTYTPQYTCCEENDKCDVYEGSCCNY